MNIRSITMEQALETLAQQSRLVPTLLFRDRESNEMSDEPFPDATEHEELNDEDNHDQLLEVKKSITA